MIFTVQLREDVQKCNVIQKLIYNISSDKDLFSVCQVGVCADIWHDNNIMPCILIIPLNPQGPPQTAVLTHFHRQPFVS